MHRQGTGRACEPCANTGRAQVGDVGVARIQARHRSGTRVSRASENRGGEQAGLVTALILLELQHQTPIRFQQLGQTLDASVPLTPLLASCSAPAGPCNPPLSVPLPLDHRRQHECLVSVASAWTPPQRPKCEAPHPPHPSHRRTCQGVVLPPLADAGPHQQLSQLYRTFHQRVAVARRH